MLDDELAEKITQVKYTDRSYDVANAHIWKSFSSFFKPRWTPCICTGACIGKMPKKSGRCPYRPVKYGNL